MVDRSDDASCLLGLAGLAVERVVLTGLGVKIVQLVTDDPDAARCPGCRVAVDVGQGLGADPAAGPAVRGGVRGRAVAQAAVAVPHRGLSARVVHRAGCAGAGRDAHDDPAARRRWRWRSRTGVTSPRSRRRTGCRGRRCSARSWPGARSSWSSPQPVTVLGMDETRFGRPRWLPDGEHRRRPGPVAADRSVGDRVRRHQRRAVAVGAGGRPDQRCGSGLARCSHRGVPGRD